VDNPAQSDFILPAVAHVGDVKIAVGTSGRSPAVARALRERIEQLVTPTDLLEIELQEKARAALKTKISDPKLRSKTLYDILNSVEIKKALSEGKTAQAEAYAFKLIDEVENQL
jgi:siroheme synthase-like protein